MKKYAIPVLVVLAALFVAGCDRFAHNFQPRKRLTCKPGCSIP